MFLILSVLIDLVIANLTYQLFCICSRSKFFINVFLVFEIGFQKIHTSRALLNLFHKTSCPFVGEFLFFCRSTSRQNERSPALKYLFLENKVSRNVFFIMLFSRFTSRKMTDHQLFETCSRKQIVSYLVFSFFVSRPASRKMTDRQLF